MSRKRRGSSLNASQPFSMKVGGGLPADSSGGAAAITLSADALTASGATATITANSSGTLVGGVYGAEYGAGSIGVYTTFKNTAGLAVNQSITVTAADGLTVDSYWSFRDYYNLNPADPPGSRVYGISFVVLLGNPAWSTYAIQRPLAFIFRPLMLRVPAYRGTLYGDSSIITLTSVAASVSGTDITITGTSSGDLTAGVYGVEYGFGPNAIYSASKNGLGAFASQSITLGAQDGIIYGYWSIRAYYNVDSLDSVSTRVYGTPVVVQLVRDPSTADTNRPLVRTMKTSWLRRPIRRNQQIYPEPEHGTIQLTNVAATFSGTDVTITGSTNRDLTNYVFGVEYGVGSSGAYYTSSKNIAGNSIGQSITIGLLDGVVAGTYISLRAYYNLDVTDPISTRVYNSTLLNLFISEFYGVGSSPSMKPLVRCFRPFMRRAAIVRRRQNSPK